MSLGIGGATPFSQASNHQTAANHTIRDTAKYDHTKQTKVKCTSCGMWATKGAACKFCKHPAGKDWLASPKAEEAKNKVPKRAEKTTVTENAHTHVHRDSTSYDHTKQTKVKCPSCGMWAKKGGNCGFCKRPVKA